MTGGSINLKSLNGTAQQIYALWDRVSRLETYPSMKALNYAPHFTFAIYDVITSDNLVDVASKVFVDYGAIKLKFSNLSYFDTDPMVLWIAPQNAHDLTKIHADIHSRIDPDLCRSYCRPGLWIPHCTLGTQVTQGNRKEAMDLVQEKFEPFEVVFDTADCVAFPPINVVQEYALD